MVRRNIFIMFLTLLILGVSCEATINPSLNFELSDRVLNFGDVAVYSKVYKELYVKNTGQKDCEISSIALNFYDSRTKQTEFSILEGALQNTLSLEQDEEHEIKVQFHPESAGNKVAQLLIEYIVNHEKLVKKVSLSGYAYTEFIQINPAMIVFNGSYIGEKQTDKVYVSNPGEKPITVKSIYIGGNSSGTAYDEFKIVSGWDGNEIVVNPDESIVIAVQFSPTSLGSKISQLFVNIDGSSLNFNCLLRGDCIPALNFITSSNLPDGVHGQPYSTKIQFEGGDGNYTVTAPNNDLPVGLSQSYDIISGTINDHGTFQFLLTLKDSLGHSASKMFTIDVKYSKLIRNSTDVDPLYMFDQTNYIGTYTVNLIAEGDFATTINSITLSGPGFTTGEATIISQPTLPLTLNPGSTTQIKVKVESLLDFGRDATLTVNHIGYNSPFSIKFEWRTDKTYVFVIDRSSSMSSAFSSNYVVHDVNGNVIPYPNRLQALQSKMADRVNALATINKFDIIAFNSTATSCFGSLKNASTQNKTAALSWLYSLNASGGTMFHSPLNSAFNSYGPVDVIQFFADGAPADGSQTLIGVTSWIQTQISYNSNFYFEVNQIGGSPMTIMIQLGALPNSKFMLW